MLWTLVGYFPKRIVTRAAWRSPYPDHPDAPFPAPMPVDEIASVSHCIARGPEDGGVDEIVNAFGGCESPAAAWRCVPQQQRGEFGCYAFKIASVLLQDGQLASLHLPSWDYGPVADNFALLGYDVVQFHEGQSLGCSPLSCNGQTFLAAPNRYCLLETAAEALELARAFSLSQPEPGPYCVAEVWRERSRPDRSEAAAPGVSDD